MIQASGSNPQLITKLPKWGYRILSDKRGSLLVDPAGTDAHAAQRRPLADFGGGTRTQPASEALTITDVGGIIRRDDASQPW
jgi:hypothetical protein